jgi:hypothetical protein
MEESSEAHWRACSHGVLRQHPLQPQFSSPRFVAPSQTNSSALLVVRQQLQL